MGNYLDKGSHTFDDNHDENVRVDSTEVAEFADRLSLSNSTTSIEVAQEAGESLNFHIFSYKQYMPCKKRQIYKWASAKLALTEELIRTNQLRTIQLQQCSYLEPDTDYLTDDEMDEVSIDKQLCSLEKYRTELVELIGRLSISNRTKSQKRKKGKRLKRRKLLSKCNSSSHSMNTDDSEMSDSSKIGLNRDKIIKRTPLKVKNY
ncbi:hypothetical protein FF38_06596 [Lucilia cuprina]|uniref:Uncharacterized protein n=1 Tax=Lucilia cuprina TaxID=7375 RepID=A0A0L0CAH6_LUCCU|nr:hypothetical protein CVS40_10237 [Lucilia cuprina]KNC29403.1 hypothetical protein FF38_06596 [Lucilia cuprina]